MTNKSLSEQLCEACGIKPNHKCKNVPCLNFMADSGICMLKDGFTKCNPEICEDDYTPDTNHRNWKEAEAVYPDFFTNNDNFVKLGELKIKTTKKYHTLFEMLSLECNFTNKKDFLEFLVNHINDKKYYSGSYIFTFRDIIKKSIKNEQWEV